MTSTWQDVGWPSARLADIATFCSGGTPSRKRSDFFTGDIPWLTGQDIPEGVVSDIWAGRECITEEGVKNSATRVVPKNTVLVTTRVTVGKTGVAACPLCFSQDVTGLILHSPAIATPHFVAYFLLSQRQRLLRRNQGSTIVGITRDSLASERIPLPPISEQRRIVEILREVEQVRQLRGTAGAKTAELLPGVFYTMFNTEISSRDSHTITLEEFCRDADDIKCGPFGTQLQQEEFTREGVPLWGIKHVNANFLIGTEEFITPVKAHELRQYNLLPGDIVMTRKGTIGNCAIYPANFPQGIMHSDLLRVRLNHRRHNAVFVAAQLSLSPRVKQQISSQSAGAVMPGINVTRLKQLRLFEVPKVHQDIFAARALEIAEISRYDRVTDASVSKLVKSLSAYAFTGDLTAEWRERHRKALQKEAAARDEALETTGVKLPRPTMLQQIEEMLAARTDGAYAELTREQHLVLEAIERGYGGVDYPRWFTAEEVARSTLSGSLRGNPQAIESHLSVLAARGLVVAVSREEQNPETGEIVYGNAYRLRLRDFEPEEGDSRERVQGDDARLREMQRLVGQLERERLQ